VEEDEEHGRGEKDTEAETFGRGGGMADDKEEVTSELEVVPAFDASRAEAFGRGGGMADDKEEVTSELEVVPAFDATGAAAEADKEIAAEFELAAFAGTGVELDDSEGESASELEGPACAEDLDVNPEVSDLELGSDIPPPHWPSPANPNRPPQPAHPPT